MTVQVRSWILLGPSVLHACSGAHVASCRVVFWRPLITDVLAPAPAHLLMGGRSTWRSVPHGTLQLLFSRSFPRQPWRLPGAFDLGVGVNWWWCSRLHWGPPLLLLQTSHRCCSAVVANRALDHSVLLAQCKVATLAAFSTPSSPDEWGASWLMSPFPIRTYISGGNHCSHCRCHNRKTADL